MHEVFQITENVGYYGDLTVVSDLKVAQDLAWQFAQIAWPDIRLTWVDPYQLSDRVGGTVFIRINPMRVDDPSGMMHVLSEIVRREEGFRFNDTETNLGRIQVTKVSK